MGKDSNASDRDDDESDSHVERSQGSDPKRRKITRKRLHKKNGGDNQGSLSTSHSSKGHSGSRDMGYFDDSGSDDFDEADGDEGDFAGARALNALRQGNRENVQSRPRGPNLGDEGSDEEDEARHMRVADEDDEDGEDLLEDAERDYREIRELDRYDMDEFDQTEYDVDLEARRSAENALRQRDMEEQGRFTRMPGMLADSDSEEDEDRAARRRAAYEFAADSGETESEMKYLPPEPVDLQNLTAPLKELIEKESVREEIKRRFEAFLRKYSGQPVASSTNEIKAAEKPIYTQRIEEMCSNNSQSLLVSYTDLCRDRPVLAVYLIDDPKRILPLLDEVASEIVLEQFPNYKNIQSRIFVRITELPLPETLRVLRKDHLRQLVRVSGIVTRCSQVMPQLKVVAFVCKLCGETVGLVEMTEEDKLPPPPSCATCGDENFDSKVVPNLEISVYRNFQRILLQESPGTVMPGRVPRYKAVLLMNDLIDCAMPGQEIEVTGVYISQLSRNLNTQQGFPVFDTCIEANYVRVQDEVETFSSKITEEERKMFYRMAKDPCIIERVINSISPSMYGHTNVKTALACAMFGGRAKNIHNKHKIRGDINVLLLGDPGMAKSQFLKYVEKVAPRAIYTTGKGASAVGLTAAVQKDPITREWMLEAGALVLADKGVCMIDEFDKMNDKDRTSIHEAMEQQSISISKAGIVTTLHARCSVIAAANPINGRYDPMKTFRDNVDLTDPIIQRFDILCVLQDRVNAMDDERLAKFVVSSHVRAHPAGCVANQELNTMSQNETDKPANVDLYSNLMSSNKLKPIPQEILKKYMRYARTLKPQIAHIDQNKLEKLYTELRAESMKTGGVPIAVRHMESVLRLGESFARMALRGQVTDDDMDRAIAVMIDSFVSAQKNATKQSLLKQFRPYISHKKDNNELLLYLLEEQLNQSQFLNPSRRTERLQVTVGEFSLRATQLGIRDLSHFFQSDQFTTEFNLEEIKHPGHSEATKYIVKRFTTSVY